MNEKPAPAMVDVQNLADTRQIAINRVGIEADYGDDDFYGTSYFVDPEGKFVGDVASDTEPEVIVRDLDMDLIKVVRDRWAFYRDRRPDAYAPLVKP